MVDLNNLRKMGMNLTAFSVLARTTTKTASSKNLLLQFLLGQIDKNIILSTSLFVL